MWGAGACRGSQGLEHGKRMALGLVPSLVRLYRENVLLGVV
jgi:hypothetical protein